MYNVETVDTPLNCWLFWLISQTIQMIPYISLVLPSIGWQVPWGKLYAHPVSLGCVLSFEHMIWCTDSTWYWDLFPLIIYMTNKKMIQSSSRYMHDIYLANRKLRCKLWWMASWHCVCFAFRDDWFACWLNIKMNSLWSHWLPWLSLIFLLSQNILCSCSAQTKESSRSRLLIISHSPKW